MDKNAEKLTADRSINQFAALTNLKKGSPVKDCLSEFRPNNSGVLLFIVNLHFVSFRTRGIGSGGVYGGNFSIL